MSKSRLTGAVLVLATTLVGGFEGLRTYAYRDVANVPTICFGETKGVKMGDRKTEEECRGMLADRLVEFESKMKDCIKEPDKIPDRTYVAFLSFTYNVGVGAFCNSTLNRLLNAGDLSGACDQILRWNRSAGIVWDGLTRRRQEERALCLSGLET